MAKTDAGGLAASGLRGTVTNSWADVDVTAVTDTGRVYAGGFIAASNRQTIVNNFALGDVDASASGTNMIFAGGFEGMEGGVHINCYSKGNVTASKPTSSIGAANGLMGGISVNKAVYYNSEAALTTAGNAAEVKSTGSNFGGATDEAKGLTAAEIAGQAFADELNANAAGIADLIKAVEEELEGGTHRVYYPEGTTLEKWVVRDGIVQFNAIEKEPELLFTDVQDPARYFYDPVYWAVKRGITVGYGGPNLFSPDAPCTREQIVTFLWRMMGEPEPEKHENFTDVKEGAWYDKAISWAAEKEITVGLNDGTGRFGVGKTCSRAMIVTFLYRYASITNK